MSPFSRPVHVYRWIVFLLAAGYCVYHVVSADYSTFGGPFRFLTIWALFLSFFAASRMLAFTEHRSERRHEVTAMCAAVLNAMVVFLYWKLYFIDPALVHTDGVPGPWWDEYYLHALGPALQILDALLVARAFRRVGRAALPLLGIIAVYVLWNELALQTFSSRPQGTVTSGLAYPFLNDMAFGARATFYLQNAAVALALLAAFSIVSRLLARRLRIPQADPG